ncbi:MAG: hypothetical protein CM1200mP30_20850 [Pseudomonadota bacterium]|nr:MAG: hypothetical protein CM1200mP30_20850 [Pseudomonadota bacterium]
MFILLAPFLWILIASFRPNMELVRNQTLIPQNITLKITFHFLLNHHTGNGLSTVYCIKIHSYPFTSFDLAGAYSVYRPIQGEECVEFLSSQCLYFSNCTAGCPILKYLMAYHL